MHPLSTNPDQQKRASASAKALLFLRNLSIRLSNIILSPSLGIPPDNHLHRLQDQPEIYCPASLPDVLHIQRDPVVETHVMSLIGNLPQAGKSRCGSQSETLIRGVSSHFIRQGRSGPHKGHMPHENIQKLRQFVERMPPNESPHPRDPGVILYLKGGPVDLIQTLEFLKAFFRVHHHGAELPHSKNLSRGVPPGFDCKADYHGDHPVR